MKHMGPHFLMDFKHSEKTKIYFNFLFIFLFLQVWDFSEVLATILKGTGKINVASESHLLWDTGARFILFPFGMESHKIV